MKRLSVFVAAALLAVSTFTSCSKDDKEDNPAPVEKTKTEIITAKSWRITGFTFKEGNGPIEDVYAQLQTCTKDDFYKFNIDKTFRFDEGATKCSSNDPQTATSAWDITADGSILLLMEMKGSATAELYDIAELTESKLRIRQTDTSNGTADVTEITFSSF